MESKFSLSNKTILVTGASSGIGRAIAIECSRMGARVVIVARNEVRLTETLNALIGDEHIMMIADLSNSAMVEALMDDMPKLDGLVNCAGVANTMMASLTDESDVMKVFENNTFSSIYIIQQVLQNKRLNKGASIVFISSISGVYAAYAGGTLYGASKAALEGYTKALGVELASRDIRVNTIAPGMIDTNLLDNSSISELQLEEDAKRYPLKRYGKPEEVAYAAVYLLSDATKWMTGTSIKLDGGYTLN